MKNHSKWDVFSEKEDERQIKYDLFLGFRFTLEKSKEKFY